MHERVQRVVEGVHEVGGMNRGLGAWKISLWNKIFLSLKEMFHLKDPTPVNFKWSKQTPVNLEAKL